jgi:AraC-like DNA-binding protein
VAAADFTRVSAFGGVTALAGRGFETRLPPHVHSSYVLGVIEEGAVQVTTTNGSAIATPGMVLLLPPFSVHTELPVAPGGWSFRYLYPTEAAVREALRLAPGPGRALSFTRPVVADPALASAIVRAHDRIRGGANEAAAADALVALLRHTRERHCQEPTTHERLRDRRNILAVRDLLVERPLRSVTLSDLASAAGLSAFHFTRVFRSEIGLPPYAYYEQVRVAFAHQLIHEGHELTSVAYQLGFSDQSHLTRHFRRASFTTPGRLAQMSRGMSSRRHVPRRQVHHPVARTGDEA